VIIRDGCLTTSTPGAQSLHSNIFGGGIQGDEFRNHSAYIFSTRPISIQTNLANGPGYLQPNSPTIEYRPRALS